MAAQPVSALYTYSRSIKMSTSQPSATGVTYSVSFKADQAYTLKTLIVDFCANSPLIGQTCSAPAGFTVGATPTVINFQQNGVAVAGSWTAASQNSGRTLSFSNATGVSVAAGDNLTLDLTTVTNPNSVTSFYARMLTYDVTSPAYSDVSTAVFRETGSVALSTANNIGFTFQVPESLSFCVYKTTCGDTPALTLGHGTNKVLDSSVIDTDTAQFSIATNALNGVAIMARGTSLKTSSYTIAPINGGSGVQAAMVAGTEAFGLKVSPTTGSIAATAAYADTGGNSYTFDNNMVPPSTGSAIIANQATPGPLSSTVMTVTFGATASSTTPANVYTAIISLIAVATF